MKKILTTIKLAKQLSFKLASNCCSKCKQKAPIIDEAFCSNECADSAFAEDAQKYLDDVNFAKCVGDKKAPVGSPRQRAFCGRMCGHKKKNTKSDTKSDPDSCINQALRRWKCRCH